MTRLAKTGRITGNISIFWSSEQKGEEKNVICIVCDTDLVSCSSSFAHIIGRPVLDQKKSNIKACVPVRKR